jgi:hypothetical protein
MAVDASIVCRSHGSSGLGNRHFPKADAENVSASLWLIGIGML